MSRKTVRLAAIIQLCLILFTGCHPTQPFFVRQNDSLANYLDQALDIEYAEVHVESLPEATQAIAPFGPNNLPDEFWELSLEDCISIALQNTKIIRVVQGSNQQSGSVSASLLSASPGQLPSIYDPALTSTTGSTQPLAIDSQGNRVASRGSVRSNQVGGVEDALSEFDAQFSALFGYNTTDRPRNVGQGNVFNPQFFRAVDSNAQAALSKRMATGTVATARFTTVYSRNNVPASGNAPGSTNFGRSVPSDYTAALELQVTQPLLRGRGTLVNRIPVTLARINEDIQLHEFEANIRNLVRDVEHAYWDLYCGYRAFEASRRARDSALNLWQVAKARTNVSDTPPEAEAQARALYYQFEAQIHASFYGSNVPGNDPRGLYGREQVLREKLGVGPTDGRLIRPADDPTTALVQFDWSSVQAEALTRNVDLRRNKWAVKQRELELISANNQILPQLDLSATYRWLGVGDEFAAASRNGIAFPSPGATAIEELTGGDYQEIGARLEYTPQAVGKRRALNNIQFQRLQIKKSQEELIEKEMALMHELSFAFRGVDSHFVNMKDYLDQWLATDDEIKIYQDKIEGDVGELSQLLDNRLRAEERRSRAQLNYFQAVCEYNKSLVNIHYLKGSLLALNNIELGEGAWVDKAYWDAEERARERAAGHYFDYGYTRPSVVSNGPVDLGGVTEGNLSDNGLFYEQAESVDAKSTEDDSSSEGEAAEANDSGEPEPLPELTRPTANLLRSSGNGSSGVSVQRTSASNTNNNFNWGEFGMSPEPAPVVVSSSNQREQPNASRRPTRGQPNQASQGNTTWQTRSN